MQEHRSEKDTYTHKGWLTSDNFFKRAFAVLGYGAIGQLLLTLLLVAILFLIKLSAT